MTQNSEDYDLLSTWFLKLSIESQSSSSRNHGKRWSEKETTLVIHLHENGYSAEEIERFLEYSRPLSGIVQRIKKHQQEKSPLLTKEPADEISSAWIRQWLSRKASAMAAKDTRQSKTGVKYTMGDVLPKIIECYQSAKTPQCFFCRRYLMLTTYNACSQSTLASFDHAIPKMAVLAPGNRFNLTCFMCNLAKHTLTMEQFQLFIDKVQSISGQETDNDDDDDDDEECWGQKETAWVRQKHAQWRKKYEPLGQFIGEEPPTKAQLLDLAKERGPVDPYTRIKGHYTSSSSQDPTFRLTFGRIRKKTMDANGNIAIHGYYLGNIQPMLLIIKYAFYTFTEFEIIAWIQAIRHHRPSFQPE